MQICLGDIPMKHPVKSDFDTAVTEAGVNVTFRPTNSIYSFYRLADSEGVARLGPVSLERVRHAGSSGDTEDYPSDKVQDMAQRIASEVAASVWSVQDEKEADKLTLRPPLIVGDEGDRPIRVTRGIGVLMNAPPEPEDQLAFEDEVYIVGRDRVRRFGRGTVGAPTS
jgi:hypothetical protein